MRVSFVIPTRNHAAFIGRCIDSCLAQAVGDAEVIVVDGASTDGTQDLLRRYGARIAWTSERDSGQAQAVNRGIARASGEVIAWINSDDYYPDPGAVPVALAAFEEDPVLDLLLGDGLFVDAAGAPLRVHRAPALRGAADLLVARTGPLQPAVFFRRALFQDVGGLREDLHYAMDYDLWLRMLGRARAVRSVRRTLACATLHRGAKSVAGVWPQVLELRALKREHARGVRLSPWGRARMSFGLAALFVYAGALRIGLRRVA